MSTAVDGEAGCRERRERFTGRYGVRQFQHSYRNLRALFKQGGASDEAVLEHLVRRWAVDPGFRHFLGDHYGRGHPFDHVELWGRDGTPLFLVGHPYQVDAEGIETLAGIGRLGMDVRIDSEGWYGFGTVQVLVCHYRTVERITRAS